MLFFLVQLIISNNGHIMESVHIYVHRNIFTDFNVKSIILNSIFRFLNLAIGGFFVKSLHVKGFNRKILDSLLKMLSREVEIE